MTKFLVCFLPVREELFPQMGKAQWKEHVEVIMVLAISPCSLLKN